MADICMFSANYLPSVGGIERFSHYVCRELISAGHNVTLVTNNMFALPTKEIVDGLTIYRFDCKPYLNGRFPVAIKNNNFKMIDSALKSAHFDLIFINARFYTHSIYAARLAHNKGVPCLTVEHGTSHLSVNNKLLDLLGGIAEHFITAILKRYCKDYYGVSKSACNWSRHFGIKSRGTLYNTVDTQEIENILNGPCRSFRKEYGIGKNEKIITFTGRLLKEKGLYELLKAKAALQDKECKLFIAGVGPLQKELEALDRDDVIYVGKLDFKDVIALLKETDIYCLPSYSEGMSTSVLEAIAAKCFVITTANGGAKELITSKEYGIILKDSNPTDLCEALNKALLDDVYRTAAAQKSYDRLKQDFTFKSTAEKIISIIK